MNQLLQISFLYPDFLWALILLILPVIIHLIAVRRYKQVQFSDISLLKEISDQGIAKKRLQDLLILCLRVLILAALVFAFAVPFQDNSQQTKEQMHWIIIDNSLSMSAGKDGETNFAVTKSAVNHLLNNLDESSQIVVASYDLNSINLEPLLLNLSKEKVEALQISPIANSTEDIAFLIGDRLQQDTSKQHLIYWFTDLQDSFPVALLPVEAQLKVFYASNGLEENLAIDSVWFNDPLRNIQGEEQLLVRVKNYGDEGIEKLKLTLTVNGVPQISLIDLNGSSEVVDTVSFLVPQEDWVQLKVEIPNDPYLFDNVFNLTYQLERKTRLLVITEEESVEAVFRSVFKTEPKVELTFVSPLTVDFAELNEFGTIVLGELNAISSGLREVVFSAVSRNRSKLVVLCDPEGDAKDYETLFNQLQVGSALRTDSTLSEIRQIGLNNRYFDDVFEDRKDPGVNKVKMPSYQGLFLLERVDPSKQVVLLTNDNWPAMIVGENVHLFLGGISEKRGSWRKSPLIVPVLYKAVFEKELTSSYQFVIGANQVLKLKQSDIAVAFNSPGQFNFTSNPHGPLKNQVLIGANFEDDGCYQMIQEKDTGFVALNYNRAEGAWYPKQYDQKISDLKDRLSNSFLSIGTWEQVEEAVKKAVEKRRFYWQYLILLALLLFVTELLLLRWGTRSSV